MSKAIILVLAELVQSLFVMYFVWLMKVSYLVLFI